MAILPASFIFTLTVLGSVLADTFTLEAVVGEDVQIRCSHLDSNDNIKLFCKALCMTEKDILVKSGNKTNPVTEGRYSLYDNGSGNFVVTISNLKKSDSGTYWCGVNRLYKYSLQEVILTVLEGKKIPEGKSDILHPTKSPMSTVSSYPTEKTDGVMYCIK